jgi:hypothetical protein
MRPTWRVLLAGGLGGLVLLALVWRPDVPPAWAQGVGIFSRADCTTLTNVVAGQTWCFDQTSNTLKSWNGAIWTTLASATGSNNALTITVVDGVGVNAVSSGQGIAVSGISTATPTTTPAVRGLSSGFYGGSFANITDGGSDVVNADHIGMVAQSIYANGAYVQQGAITGAGSTLGRNNIYSGLYVTRVAAGLGGFDFTAPLLRIQDTTAASGSMMDIVRSNVQLFTIASTGGVNIGPSTLVQQGAGTLNVASATFINGLSALVASANGANLTNIRGLSASSNKANNLRGTCSFSAASTCAVAFASNEPDANYFLATSCSAAAAANVHPIGITSKATSGFTMTATVSNSNACDWILVR